MSTETTPQAAPAPIRLVPRGKILFIVVGIAAAIPFVDWANAVAEPFGVPLEVQSIQGQGQQGNYSVSIGTEGWKGMPNYRRVAALVAVYQALEAGGIEAEGADGQQVLNLATSGPRDGESRGRVSRMNLFLNLGNLVRGNVNPSSGTHNSGTQVVENAGETAYTAATEAFLEAGGNIDTFCAKHGSKPISMQTAILRTYTKNMPAAEVEIVEDEQAEADEVGM